MHANLKQQQKLAVSVRMKARQKEGRKRLYKLNNTLFLENFYFMSRENKNSI